MKLDKKKLDLLRAQKCLTVKDLAAAADTSQPTINRGYSTDIDVVSVGKISRALGVDPRDIIQEGE